MLLVVAGHHITHLHVCEHDLTLVAVEAHSCSNTVHADYVYNLFSQWFILFFVIVVIFEINHEGILYVHCNSSDYKHICHGIVDIQQQNNITIFVHVLIEYPEVEVYTDQELLSKILII